MSSSGGPVGGSYAGMTRRKSEPKLTMPIDRATLPHDSAAYMLFLEAQVAKNLTMPQQLHTLDERMAALAAAQKAVATRCSELDGKISGSVKLVKIAQSFAEQVSFRTRRRRKLRLFSFSSSFSFSSLHSHSHRNCRLKLTPSPPLRDLHAEHGKLQQQLQSANVARAQLQDQMVAAASAGLPCQYN